MNRGRERRRAGRGGGKRRRRHSDEEKEETEAGARTDRNRSTRLRRGASCTTEASTASARGVNAR